MCGIAEATLAVTVLAAGASFYGQQQQKEAQEAAQASVDKAAYQRYQLNLQSLNKQKDQLRTQSAQKQLAQSIELRDAQGKARVAQGEKGLGQFALAGNSADSVFSDMLFQAATGRQRLKGDLNDRFGMISLQKDASYNSYLAQNASFQPVFGESILTPITKIGSGFDGYLRNDSRQYFKSKSGEKTGYPAVGRAIGINP